MTTPTKSSSSSSKKHGHYAHHIESPGGPTAVRQTTFRLLGYFVFSAGQLDRRQFTLNRVCIIILNMLLKMTLGLIR